MRFLFELHSRLPVAKVISSSEDQSQSSRPLGWGGMMGVRSTGDGPEQGLLSLGDGMEHCAETNTSPIARASRLC